MGVSLRSGHGGGRPAVSPSCAALPLCCSRDLCLLACLRGSRRRARSRSRSTPPAERPGPAARRSGALRSAARRPSASGSHASVRRVPARRHAPFRHRARWTHGSLSSARGGRGRRARQTHDLASLAPDTGSARFEADVVRARTDGDAPEGEGRVAAVLPAPVPSDQADRRRRSRRGSSRLAVSASPVIVDPNVWMYSSLRGRSRAGRRGAAARVRAPRRLDTRLLDVFEDLPLRVFDRPIRHVLLVHANLLNRRIPCRSARRPPTSGYALVSLQRALEDPAYTALRPTSRGTGSRGSTAGSREPGATPFKGGSPARRPPR